MKYYIKDDINQMMSDYYTQLETAISFLKGYLKEIEKVKE